MKNSDPIWLLQNEMYEELYKWEQERDAEEQAGSQGEPVGDVPKIHGPNEELPF